ncbi:hypothetical protein QJS10_CPA03g01393 [Acorus calamus]|uniref:Reverse transcriptase zinc-binding domain-containing protein n=1 Tax=Acorus calamus TaxID=4465 RepID=A0AAV9F8B4_ACOCL|nr:hypothetical protein QJS10_CPA03g01393 [Acorus calamus]
MGTQNTLKIKAFTWLLFQEKILTKIARAKWSHQEDTMCSLCGSAEETVEHLVPGMEVVEGGYWFYPDELIHSRPMGGGEEYER